MGEKKRSLVANLQQFSTLSQLICFVCTNFLAGCTLDINCGQKSILICISVNYRPTTCKLLYLTAVYRRRYQIPKRSSSTYTS